MSTEYNGYKIESDKTYSMKMISPLEKGSVPLELRGAYTSTREAELAIDQFLATPKGTRNAKVKSAN